MPVSTTLAPPPVALIANDHEWLARSLESILGPSGFAVVRAYDRRQVFDFARSVRPDVIVLDHGMDDRQGVDICRALRDDAVVGPHTPIVLTSSGPLDYEQCREAIASGVWDTFVQPVNGELLLLKLWNFVRAKREADRMREESLLDQATGLYNMRGLARRAREIGAEASRQHHPLACVVFTTDAGAGDEVLVSELAARVAGHLAEICRRTGRVSDAIGRLGYSEFGIVAPSTEEGGVLRLVARLQEALAEAPFAVGQGERQLQLRAGYCVSSDFGDSSVDAVEMLLRAAAALRETKSDGAAGGRVRAFHGNAVRFVQ